MIRQLGWLSLLLVGMLGLPAAHAAVAVDAVGPGATGAFDLAGSLSWSHTSSGTDRLLVVGVAIGINPDVLSITVTHNGAAMTSAGKVHSNNGAFGFVEMFYLVAPATGAQTVQVNLSGSFSASIEAGSVSFTGVDQISPIRNITTNYGSSATASVSLSSAVGNMVVDALAGGSGITSADGAGQTQRWKKNFNTTTGAGNGAQSTATGAATVNLSWTVVNDWWGIIAMDVQAVGAPCASVGALRWIPSDSKLKYCNGSNAWVDTTVSTGASCAGTTAGTTNYAAGVMNFCDGTNWISTKGSSLGSCAGATAGTFNYNAGVYRFCDATNWYQMGP